LLSPQQVERFNAQVIVLISRSAPGGRYFVPMVFGLMLTKDFMQPDAPLALTMDVPGNCNVRQDQGA